MAICTAAKAVSAMQYWIGYYEKASSSYATTRAKSAFTSNKGNNNYTYAGYLCGVQGQAWCAAQVSTAIYEACGSSSASAKQVMYGVWPYVNCAQVWDAAPSNKKFWSYYQRWTLGKGERKTYKPVAGDIIVFTDNGKLRSHTGMVYSCDGTYVYTIEGNSGNMCRKRSYKLTSSYIYGWIRPAYAAATTTTTTTSTTATTTSTTASTTNKVKTKIEQYGSVCCKDPELHVLSKGCAGPEVATIQRILLGAGIKGEDGKDIVVDEDFGKNTEYGVKQLQKKLGITQDGKVGKLTWPAALKKFGV